TDGEGWVAVADQRVLVVPRERADGAELAGARRDRRTVAAGPGGVRRLRPGVAGVEREVDPGQPGAGGEGVAAAVDRHQVLRAHGLVDVVVRARDEDVRVVRG